MPYKRGRLVLLFLALTGTASAADLSLVQETSLTAQLQTVQAANYWGTYQTSLGAGWTLGLDWDRWIALRAGLTARAVQTSPIVSNTVYPGYQGAGWIAALDWLPLNADWVDTRWSAGVTAAVHREFLSYPGLYRDFTLPGATLALVGEAVPQATSGLAYRLRIPVGLDQRDSFWLSWRMGLEVAVVFRGVAWSFP
jgi:hypothetical protein